MTATDRVSELFDQAGCQPLDVPILQPADNFLNTAGEAFRKSLFITQGADGETLCLRPEFTIPVCRHHMETAKQATRYSYRGTVFRQRPDPNDNRPTEFEQAGIEALGDQNFAKADAEMVRLAVDAVSAFPDVEPEILIGDPAFFNAFVTPIGLPEIWRDRLIRVFGDDFLIERTLKRMVSPESAAAASLSPEVQSMLDAGNRDELIAFINRTMAEQGLLGAGGRDAEEVADRLFAKSAERVKVPHAVAERCREFLATSCDVSDVQSTFVNYAAGFEGAFDQALTTFDERMKAGLSAINVPIRFAAGFGRRLDYYTGFVFEIRDRNDPEHRALAGGGRYDRLTEMLGGEIIPAVGFSLWPDRLKAGGRS